MNIEFVCLLCSFVYNSIVLKIILIIITILHLFNKNKNLKYLVINCLYLFDFYNYL